MAGRNDGVEMFGVGPQKMFVIDAIERERIASSAEEKGARFQFSRSRVSLQWIPRIHLQGVVTHISTRLSSEFEFGSIAVPEPHVQLLVIDDGTGSLPVALLPRDGKSSVEWAMMITVGSYVAVEGVLVDSLQGKEWSSLGEGQLLTASLARVIQDPFEEIIHILDAVSGAELSAQQLNVSLPRHLPRPPCSLQSYTGRLFPQPIVISHQKGRGRDTVSAPGIGERRKRSRSPKQQQDALSPLKRSKTVVSLRGELSPAKDGDDREEIQPVRSDQVEELIRGTDAGLSWKSLTAKLGIEETDNNSVNCLRAHVEELICNGRVYQNGELFMSL